MSTVEPLQMINNIILLLSLTSASEVMFLLRFICLSCQQDISISYGRLLMKFCGKVWHEPRTSRLDFGGDLDPDSGSGSKLLLVLTID